jgi:hypothetical protein
VGAAEVAAARRDFMATGRVPADSDLVCPCSAFSTFFDFFWIKKLVGEIQKMERGSNRRTVIGSKWNGGDWNGDLMEWFC